MLGSPQDVILTRLNAPLFFLTLIKNMRILMYICLSLNKSFNNNYKKMNAEQCGNC